MLNTWFLVCWKGFFKLAHHGLNLIKLGISTTEEIKGVAFIQGKVNALARFSNDSKSNHRTI